MTHDQFHLFTIFKNKEKCKKINLLFERKPISADSKFKFKIQKTKQNKMWIAQQSKMEYIYNMQIMVGWVLWMGIRYNFLKQYEPVCTIKLSKETKSWDYVLVPIELKSVRHLTFEKHL